MSRYSVTATTSAPVETVWNLLLDGRDWPRWGVMDELVEEKSSGMGSSPDGHDTVGTIRAYRTGRWITGERLTAVEPLKLISYESVFSSLFRNYTAHIELSPASQGGTSIHWHGTWRNKPGLGWLMPFILPRSMQQMADRVAAEAEGQASAG